MTCKYSKISPVKKKLGVAHLLQVKRVIIPKGWILVDSCTPHAGAPAENGFGPRGFHVHVYTVNRAAVVPALHAAAAAA